MARKVLLISIGSLMALVIFVIGGYVSAAQKTEVTPAIVAVEPHKAGATIPITQPNDTAIPLRDEETSTVVLSESQPPATSIPAVVVTIIANETETITYTTINDITPVSPMDSSVEAFISPGDEPSDLIATVKYLKAAIQEYYNVSGWIFIKSESFNFRRPDGSIDMLHRPDHYVTESWYHINAAKLVDECVTLEKSMDGQILQATVSHAGKFEPFSLRIDEENLNRHIEYAATNPHTVEVIDSTTVKITVVDMSPEPFTLDGYEKRITGTIGYNYYDIDTGSRIQSEVIILFEDGSNEVLSRVIFTIRLDLTPPPETMSWLNES
jgi:hypothetical protein